MPVTKNLQADYLYEPRSICKGKNREIADFTRNDKGENIDPAVVKSFGEEWNKFHLFPKSALKKIYQEYFDIIDSSIVNPDTYLIDIGCGSARWSEYFLDKVGFIEAVDPSDAIFAADKLLEDKQNIRLTKASVETLPWPDETFDVGISIGVLHHIPDTAKALIDCVKKIRKGGYFYVYLYYRFDQRGMAFKFIFQISDLVRKLVSRMPSVPKKITCDVLAVVAYMPFVWLSRFIRWIGFPKTAESIPLSNYADKPFYIIRNDSLDRFGTRLENRFTRDEIRVMMENSGLTDIVFSEKVPYWHAIGKKK